MPVLLRIPMLAILLLGVTPTAADAAGRWTAVPLNAAAWPAEIVPETRAPAPPPDGLPDGLMAQHDGPGDIVAAWYAGPTERYAHAVLGDGVEAGILKVRTRSGALLSAALSEKAVFEDRYPRLADLDGDGTVEVVTIRSSLDFGASVAVYGLRGGRLVERATTGHLGIANRWLNVAGIARFADAPGMQIAYVATPHIGGRLHFQAFEGGALRRLGRLEGFSNHRIGARELRLSAVADLDGDGRSELALPSEDRRALRIVGFRDRVPAVLAEAPLPGRIDKAIAVEGSGPTLRFIVGLDDGRVFAVGRRAVR